MKALLARILPFISFGIFIFLFILGFIVVSSLLLYGAVIALLIFAALKLKRKFFPNKHQPVRQPNQKQTVHKGRTFDHDDL